MIGKTGKGMSPSRDLRGGVENEQIQVEEYNWKGKKLKELIQDNTVFSETAVKFLEEREMRDKRMLNTELKDRDWSVEKLIQERRVGAYQAHRNLPRCTESTAMLETTLLQFPLAIFRHNSLRNMCSEDRRGNDPKYFFVDISGLVLKKFRRKEGATSNRHHGLGEWKGSSLDPKSILMWEGKNQ